MPAKHVPAPRAHPADTLVVAGADHPLCRQAEDNRGHPVLMSCGNRKGESALFRKKVTFRIKSQGGEKWGSPPQPGGPADSRP